MFKCDNDCNRIWFLESAILYAVALIPMLYVIGNLIWKHGFNRKRVLLSLGCIVLSFVFRVVWMMQRYHEKDSAIIFWFNR